MNILVTNFDESGEDVMIFSNKWTPEKVRAELTAKKKTFEEIYEVPDSEVRYYVYDPCWL